MTLLQGFRLWRLGRQYSAAWSERFTEDHETWDAAIGDGFDTED